MKYPNIKVKLSGTDGNAFAIMGKVIRAMRENNVQPEEIKEFQKEVKSGDYEHLLITCMDYVDVS